MTLFNNRTNNNSRFYSLSLSLSLFIFTAFYFAYSGAYNVGFALLTLFSLLTITSKKISLLSYDTKTLITVFLIYVLINALSVYMDGGQLKELDRPAKFIIAIIVLLGLLRFPLKKELFFYGIGSGAICACAVASYNIFIQHLERGLLSQMAIQAGDASMFFGLCSLCIGFYYSKTDKKQCAFFMLTTLAGMIGSLLSGSRGGWVATPFIFLLILYFNRQSISINKKLTIISLLIIMSITTTFIVIPHSPVINAIDAGISDTQLYFNKDNSEEKQREVSERSVSIRLSLWKSSWYSFLDKPILGWGNNGINQSRAQQEKKGLMTDIFYNQLKITPYDAHNEYLNQLARRGILGFLSILSLLIIPGRFFYRHVITPKSEEQFVFALSGLVFILSVAGFCLSQSFIGTHNSGSVLFSSMVVVLYALTEHENNPSGYC